MYDFPSYAISIVGVSMSDVASPIDVGKAGKHLNQGAEVGRQNKSHALHEYEILIGDPRGLRWVEGHGVPNPSNFGARHVSAGVDAYGYQIFVVRVGHAGGVHPARASSGASGMSGFFGSRIQCPLGSLNLIHCRRVPCLWRQRVGIPGELESWRNTVSCN